MNNKCGCGCDQGFVPVSGNWDFNMDGGACQRQNRCNTREAETNCKRAVREDICPVCGKARNACTCGQYTRAQAAYDTCKVETTRQRCAHEDVCPVCGQARNACTCAQTAYEACPAQNNAPACVMKTAEAARGAKKGVGIVRVTKQALNDIYDNARALKAGTLFPELHKPMDGYAPCGAECGTDCQQAAFAAWEVRLYLDTHPDDMQARALLQQLVGDCCEPNYATTFLNEECARWAWTDDPWPWNLEANRCK